MSRKKTESIDRMVLRWTPEQREKAHAIVNDIAEDIDNKETRQELRQALAIYADMLCDALQQRSDDKLDRLADGLHKLALAMNKDKQ